MELTDKLIELRKRVSLIQDDNDRMRHFSEIYLWWCDARLVHGYLDKVYESAGITPQVVKSVFPYSNLINLIYGSDLPMTTIMEYNTLLEAYDEAIPPQSIQEHQMPAYTIKQPNKPVQQSAVIWILRDPNIPGVYISQRDSQSVNEELCCKYQSERSMVNLNPDIVDRILADLDRGLSAMGQKLDPELPIYDVEVSYAYDTLSTCKSKYVECKSMLPAPHIPTTQKTYRRFRFSDYSIPVGADIESLIEPGVFAKVTYNNAIEFKGQTGALSTVTRAVYGEYYRRCTDYWTFNGTPLSTLYDIKHGKKPKTTKKCKVRP